MPIIYHISVLLYSIGKRGLLLLGSISAALSGLVPEGPPRGRECGLLSRTAVGNQAYPSLRAPFFFSLPLLPGPIPTPIPLMLPKQVRLVETYINLLSLSLFRCELFDTNLQKALDQSERSNLYSSNPSLA